MKIIARQTPPEEVVYPYDPVDELCLTDSVAIYGNREYHEHIAPWIQDIRDVLYDGELADMLDDINAGKGEGHDKYASEAEAIAAYIIGPNGETVSEEDAYDTATLIMKFTDPLVRKNFEQEIMTRILATLTGCNWEWTTIQGCVQDEWNYILYNADEVSAYEIGYIEAALFNGLEEYTIIELEDDETEADADESSTYTEYLAYDPYCDTKQLLANMTGYAPENITVYKFTGYKRIPTYEEA